MTYTYELFSKFTKGESLAREMKKSHKIIKASHSALQANKSEIQLSNAKILNVSPTLYYSQLELTELEELANGIRANFRHLVIIGMGGAILNPRAVLEFAAQINLPSAKIEIIYSYHLNNHELAKLEQKINLQHTAFLTISKSGETLETLVLLRYWLDSIARSTKRAIAELGHQFYFILGAGPSTLRSIATELTGHILDHDSQVGGRFSSFTEVVLLPALVKELPIADFCLGGTRVLESWHRSGHQSLPGQGAALIHFLLNSSKYNSLATIAYSPSLNSFLQWQQQIIAESLGKDGRGCAALSGLGPLDQHSQAQLYLDGPKDKVLTIIFPGHLKNQPQADSIERALSLCCRATYTAFGRRSIPTRLITCPTLNLRTLGALMMHTIIETTVAGLSSDINPFDQPGVALIKELMVQQL